MLGTLFIGYTGSPTGGQKCSETTCSANDRSSAFKAGIKYYFPSWLITKVLMLSITEVNAEPTMCLAVRNVIPLNSLYFATQKGFIEQLKSLFSNRQAQPNDIGGIYGDTSLHVSTFHDLERGYMPNRRQT